MKKIIFSISFTLLIILSMSILLGCAQKKRAADEVLVWIPGDENEYGFYFDMFERFKSVKESMGASFKYTIEQQPWGEYWTKLPLEVNNGRGPDLFLSHVAYYEILKPISKELDFDNETLSKFKVYDLYTGDSGKPIFIPTVFVSKLMYANLAVVEPRDKYPDTWAEFLPLAKSYTSEGVIGFDYPFHLLWDITYQNNLKLTDSNGAVFNDLGLKAVLEWTEDGVVDYLNYGKSETTLYEGAAAFIYGEPWMEYWAPEEVKLAAFPVPGGITNNSAELSFGINKNVSEEKFPLLNEFVKFMLTDPETITAIVKGNSGAPNNNEVSVSYEPLTAGDAVMKTFENYESRFAVPPRALELVYKTMLENTLLGKSIPDAIEEANQSAEDIDVSLLQKMESKF